MAALPTPPAAPSASVGVVTVSFHSAGVLAGFLRSVPGASEGALTTVVADNAEPADDVVRDLTDAAGGIYVPLDRNRGYGAAINAAVEALPGDTGWILISNPDVELRPGSIDRMREAGEADASIAAVGPTILTAEGEVYPSARAVPSLRTGVGHALFVNLWTTNPWTRAYRQGDRSDGQVRDAGWLSGACLLVRRSAFDEVGGFDESFFMYFEDVDLGYRLGKAGYRNRFEPTAVVVHTGAHSTNTDSAGMVRAHHDSAKRFLAKKYPGVVLWPVRTALRVGLAVRSALVVRRLTPRR